MLEGIDYLYAKFQVKWEMRKLLNFKNEYEHEVTEHTD